MSLARAKQRVFGTGVTCNYRFTETRKEFLCFRQRAACEKGQRFGDRHPLPDDTKLRVLISSAIFSEEDRRDDKA